MAVDDERLEATARTSAEKGEQKDKQDSSGNVARRSWKGSLWLCYAGVWLGDKKVGSQIIGEDRFPKRRAVGEVRRGGRRANNRAKKRVYRFRVNLGETEEQVACHASALAMTDEARQEAEM